jgi:N-acetylglucosaminyldiphosphoundecaprenol N-acetyl-beta-D-mannosaminyltransferase
LDTLYLDKISIVSTNLTEIRDYFSKILADKGEPALIITFNLEIYRKALLNKDCNRVCRNAELVLPDGISITHLLELKYKKKINRITGTDLFELILSISSDMSIRVAFVGSSEKVIQDLFAKVSECYPGCKITAALSPILYFENNEAKNNLVLETLKKAKPDVLFLALNNSRGELWLDKYKDQIGAKINIGVGAVFDFYTGNKKRSPVFFQRLSLEWAWRLFQEPKRLYKRYLIHGIPFFIKKTVQIIFKNDI